MAVNKLSSPFGPYDSGTYYLSDGWDSAWKFAKIQSAHQPVVVNIMGDSISVGVNRSYARSFGNQLAQYLQSTYGAYGDYWPTSYGYLGSFGPWSSAASSAVYTGGGPFGEFLYSSSLAASALQTWTAPYPVTAMDFLWWDNFTNSATWQYSIDGAAGTTITNAATAVNFIRRTSVTGLSYAPHTFSWGWQSANAACASGGLSVLLPGATSGIYIARHGGPGASTQWFNTEPGDFTGIASVGRGLTGLPTGAQLSIIELSANDINGGLAIGAFQQALTQLIRGLRRAQFNCSIAFVITSYPDGTIDDASSAAAGFANQTTAYTWHQAIYQIAQHQGCAVVDVHKRWGATPFAKGFLPSGNLHPLEAGQNDITTAIQEIL
ncbi:MAG: SGNH/GDSL hydrolase family protein [Chloroflexota bacterium]|nr:MAG: hypothetical protein DLM70_14475 [Chloroflexota bacterium]